MGLGWRHALAGAAVLFFLFLVVKMRPVRLGDGWLARLFGRGGRPGLAADVRAARDRVHAATTPEERTQALCEAGSLAASGRRWTAAAGFFLRAMRAQPASAAAVDATVAALKRHRPKLLEKILWRRLAHVAWDGAEEHAAHAAAVGLASLYRSRIHDPARAEVLTRLAARLERSAPERRG